MKTTKNTRRAKDQLRAERIACGLRFSINTGYWSLNTIFRDPAAFIKATYKKRDIRFKLTPDALTVIVGNYPRAPRARLEIGA